MSKYSEEVMEKVRQRLGVDENDTTLDLDIAGMHQSTVFAHCLEWEGVIGYDQVIRRWIEDIYGVELNEEE